MIKTTRNLTYDPSLTYPEEVNSYEYVSFTIGAATTDYDVKANQGSSVFYNVPTARFVEIKTNQPITIKFNSTSNPGIELTATEGKLIIEPARERLAVTNIFITTTVVNTTIKLFMT